MDFFLKLYRSCAPIWPPCSRGETNYIIAKQCAVHFFGVRSLCFVKCGSLNCGHLPSKILFSRLEILLKTESDIIFIFVEMTFPGYFFPSDGVNKSPQNHAERKLF